MQSPEFARAVQQLIGLSGHWHVALMCAERKPSRCYRSLRAGFLVTHSQPVFHLIGARLRVPHRLSPHLRVESATLIYDKNDQTQLPGV